MFIYHPWAYTVWMLMSILWTFLFWDPKLCIYYFLFSGKSLFQYIFNKRPSNCLCCNNGVIYSWVGPSSVVWGYCSIVYVHSLLHTCLHNNTQYIYIYIYIYCYKLMHWYSKDWINCFKKWHNRLIIFSKNALTWSKVKVKIYRFHNYILNKCC